MSDFVIQPYFAGTGALGIPHALSRSGWVGLFFLLLSAAMAQFTSCLLIRCLYHPSYSRLESFSDIGYATFGRIGWSVSIGFSQVFLLSTSILYVILAGDNLPVLLYSFTGAQIDRKVCIWILAAAIGLPFVMVRNMRDVSFMSCFSSMATFCLLLIVTVSSTSDFKETVTHAHHDWAIPRNIPITFSTFTFSYCGNIIFPHLEASMREPNSWSKVMFVATFVITLIYVIMGFFCYLVYGDAALVPIYKNLPTAAQNVAMIVVTIHVFLTVPMYLYVFTMSVESWIGLLPHDRQKAATACESSSLLRYPTLIRTIVRIIEMVLCATVAVLVPYFGEFTNLIGTLTGELLTFVLPCMFWIKLSWHQGNHFERTACIFVMLIGIFCAIFGSIDAVTAIVKTLESHGAH
ncbi:transmembrane amino acid transporter protein-domain-containing protein [Radiomyces spectabilis]|uniref:transmembrane amino acid transporter protein-domain-containing protein n=1 Tax=Radiomyces spectabilis TaxID=64574 RepID=UPI00221F1444|nr:transmembrane amino acid transporter protein-domain-containing protein [Radiomyces spectabilis]KAI8384681.1 transmembrane amino acid transporter protein-domain-containing protein [Radiomyces spectabilis]